MQLTTGVLFWPGRAPAVPEHAPLTQNISCDVAVVGGGISGALVAAELVRAGLDTVVLDKRAIAVGSTAANTALLLYELDTSLRELVHLRGEAAAVQAYRLCVEAIGQLRELVGSHAAACDFRMRKSLYVASRAKDVRGLQEECALRRRHGISCDYLDEGDLETRLGKCQPGAILSYDAAQVDPCRLTRLLIDRAIARGLRVFNRTEVLRYAPGHDCVRLTTGAGFSITAHYVVYANGYECDPEFLRGRTISHITYAAVSQPLTSLEGWWERCLMWETARPYFYLRTTEDGRAMIGGEDDPGITAPTPNVIERKCTALRKKFNDVFPDLEFEPAATWAGVFKTTPDSLPYIGPHPSNANVLFNLGYGGNGTTFSMIGANIICDLCRGRRNKDIELFRPRP